MQMNDAHDPRMLAAQIKALRNVDRTDAAAVTRALDEAIDTLETATAGSSYEYRASGPNAYYGTSVGSPGPTPEQAAARSPYAVTITKLERRLTHGPWTTIPIEQGTRL